MNFVCILLDEGEVGPKLKMTVFVSVKLGYA